MNKLSVLLPILLVAYATSTCNFKRDWQYSLIRVEWNSTNEKAFNAKIRDVRINNDPFNRGVNGTVTIGTQLDDSFRVNLYVDRGTDSAGARLEPSVFGFRNKSFYDFMNNLYKTQFMDELHRCANQQLFDKMTEPVKPHKVHLKSCYFPLECFINHLNPGWFRFTFEFVGDAVTFVGSAFARVYKY